MRSSPICRPQYNSLVPVDVNHRLFLNIIFSPPYRVSSSPCNTKRIYHFVFIYLLFGNLRESQKFPPPLSNEKKNKKKQNSNISLKFHRSFTFERCALIRRVYVYTTPTQILLCMMIAHILPSSWMVRFFFFTQCGTSPVILRTVPSATISTRNRFLLFFSTHFLRIAYYKGYNIMTSHWPLPFILSSTLLIWILQAILFYILFKSFYLWHLHDWMCCAVCIDLVRIMTTTSKKLPHVLHIQSNSIRQAFQTAQGKKYK